MSCLSKSLIKVKGGGDTVSFIEDFYYGNIEPQECTTELTKKVKKSLNELSGKEEHLTSILADKEQELFADYVATYIKFSSLCNANSFTVGFRLGARFTYDTFIEKGKDK